MTHFSYHLPDGPLDARPRPQTKISIVTRIHTFPISLLLSVSLRLILPLALALSISISIITVLDHFFSTPVVDDAGHIYAAATKPRTIAAYVLLGPTIWGIATQAHLLPCHR